jgi:hypothetical protein
MYNQDMRFWMSDIEELYVDEILKSNGDQRWDHKGL